MVSMSKTFDGQMFCPSCREKSTPTVSRKVIVCNRLILLGLIVNVEILVGGSHYSAMFNPLLSLMEKLYRFYYSTDLHIVCTEYTHTRPHYVTAGCCVMIGLALHAPSRITILQMHKLKKQPATMHIHNCIIQGLS